MSAVREAHEMLHISLLGEQSISDDATGTVRTRSSRSLALVAFLVVHAGSPQSRQRIAGLFWPESTDAQALTNLRRELHHLRQLLGDPPLVVTSRDLCWDDTPTCRVDVRTFDTERRAALAAAAADDTEAVIAHAGAAISCYRSELLPGAYDDWLLDARSELESQCVELCDLSRDARTRTGDLAGAAEAARRRIQLRPLEEAGYRSLMTLQADLGDRAGAVSTYHHCASVLERELGLAPDRTTLAALQRVMARADPATPPPSTIDLPPARTGPAAAKLVGRTREMQVLRTLWAGAAAGRPVIALVCGDPGVGKSRLVAEVAELARRQGAVVASTQCFGASGRLALAPVADWLRNPAIRSSMAALEPVWRVEVDRLVPSAEGRGEPGASLRAMVDAWQRHRFYEGLARALLGVGRPMLLVLDNVQWCDKETLEFLTFALGRASDRPVMVAATRRDETLDDEAGAADWAVRMRATGMLTELPVSPLEVADTARLAEEISGQPLPDEDAGLLQAATGGFPLYVVEAARATVDLGSADPAAAPLPVSDLTAVLRNRLDQVTPTAHEVAGLAAAVGRNFTLDLLSEASDLDAGDVVHAVDELWRRRIIREFRDGYDFSHDLLRDTAYAQISPPKRWLLHRRIAQGLELLHPDDTDGVSAQLAEQYARGGRAERAVTYYRRAADVAAGRFAHDEAIRLHQEALTILRALPAGRDRDSRELGVLEALAAPVNARYGYSSPRLQNTLERTVTLAERLGRKDSVLGGLIGLWASRFVQGRIADAHRTAERLLTVVEPDSDLNGAAHFAFGGSAVSLGMPQEALRHFEVAAELDAAASLSVGTRPVVHGKAWSAHAHWLLDHDAEAAASCRDAIALARSIGHPYNLAVALAYGSITHQMRHDLPELNDTVAELRELCDRYDFAYYREWGLILDGWARTDGSGADLARRGIENLRSEGAFARMPYWLSLLAEASARDYRAGAVRATLDAALVAGQARDDLWWMPHVMRMRAAHDDPDAAVARLLSAAQMARAHGSIALLRRCDHDLAERGVRPPANATTNAARTPDS
ncbi:ATP-binding protein [Pseudonocardia alaniniphila]|uniref:AAA family ATPase n=1 Tax=Pseudonocardia alaniniphila TaxID=75291 RepID=A0ABS9TL20_9PSEU|nr:AAA family ATPase [Pseudonocardia alaniniphila]MCH6169215.1 AAA family ATPase [Pseudonocardia alaniniphila]